MWLRLRVSGMNRRRREWVPQPRLHVQLLPGASGPPGASAAAGGIFSACSGRGWVRQLSGGTGGGRQRGKRDRGEGAGVRVRRHQGRLQAPNYLSMLVGKSE